MTIASAAPKTTTTQAQPQAVYYPESDGKPMAETDTHANLLIYLRSALDDYFRDSPNVYVSGNLLIYYEEGNPSASVAPDVFVVKGVKKGDRRTFKIWEEGKPPDLVIEITSRSTRYEDQGSKRALYASLGVPEYFLYDPLEEYLQPPLQGYHLERNDYVRIIPDAHERLHSPILGLALENIAGELRVIDPRTGKALLTSLEAQAIARTEAAARQAAESELARVRAELKRLREGRG